MQIPLKPGAEFPKRAKVYTQGQDGREVIDKTFDTLHDQKRMSWAETHTPSAYPVFVVWKWVEGKRGEPPVRKGRVVVDIRNLNAIAEPDIYPVQQQDDLLRRIGGKKYFTVVDAASFFYQWPVAYRHRNRLAVVTHRGQEVFNVAPMGYINSIAYVARQMAITLRGCEDYSCVYVDDIVIYSDSFTDHLSHLSTVFSRLNAINITLSPSKTYIGFTNVKLLGQKVSSLGMTTTADRAKALVQLSFPKTLKELEHYIGLTGWLRNFIPYYAAKIQPLQDLKTALLARSPSDKGEKRRAYTKRTEIGDPTPAERAAYDAIQACFVGGLFLRHQDASKVLFMDIDASKDYGFGAMIFHVKDSWPGLVEQNFKRSPTRDVVEPIAFYSRSLSAAERKFFPTELEIACLVWVLRKARHMVDAACRTVVYTDHASNVDIAKQATNSTPAGGTNLRLVNAAITIQSFRNLEVFHIPGKINIVPDALSRLPQPEWHDGIPSSDEPMATVQVTTRSHRQQSLTAVPHIVVTPPQDDHAPSPLELDFPTPLPEQLAKGESTLHISDTLRGRLRRGYLEDPRLSRIMEEVVTAADKNTSKIKLPYYLDQQGLLWCTIGGDRLCIPPTLHKEFIEIAHTRLHLGRQRTLERLQPFSIYKGARQVATFVKNCPVCLQNSTRRHKPWGELEPILEPFTPFHTVTIDIVLGLPDGPYDAMLTLTDKATKRTTYIPGRSDWDAEGWADALDERLAIGDWGTPRKIISDRDPKWVAALWQRLWTNRGVHLAYTTAYHAQGDGQSEVTNQVAEIALRSLIGHLATPYNWHLTLPYLQSVLNSSISHATKTTPHRLMFGTDLPAAFGPLTDHRNEALGHKGEWYDASTAVADAIMTMKRHYDKRHLPLQLQSGDKVMLRLHKGYNIPTTKEFPKVSQQYAGPFTIKRKVGNLAYELNLPPTMKIHPVISVAHLDPAPRSADPFGREPPRSGPISEADAGGFSDVYEIQSLLSRRHRTVRGKRRTEYLVKWKGWGNEHNAWYDSSDLTHAKEAIADLEARIEATKVPKPSRRVRRPLPPARANPTKRGEKPGKTPRSAI